MGTLAMRSSKLRLFFPMLFDLFAPIITYYLLHLAGLSDFVALTAGGFVSGVNAALDVVRNRQAKSISILVLVLFIVSIVLVFATQDARIILIKPSIFIGVAGLFVLSTAFRRPFLLDGMQPFATQGDPREDPKMEYRLAGKHPILEQAADGYTPFRTASAVGSRGAGADRLYTACR